MMNVLQTLAPEIWQLLLVAGLMLHSLVAKRGEAAEADWVVWASLAGLVVSALSLGAEAVFMGGAYRIDGLSQFFKLAVAAGFFITAGMTSRQAAVEPKKRLDAMVFFAISAWGLMLISSATELLTLYVALEISSFALFSVVPLRSGSRKAAEAGAKYIIFAAAATALGLYGLGFILAAHHTTFIGELAGKPWSFAEAPMAAVGLTLFLAGLMYKLALFPFHFWAPDVYDGSSNETAAFVATLPKLGATVALVRLAALLKPGLEVTTALAVLGAVSMTYGNLAALAQRDLKRLLGYSSVAHAGYVMLGLAAGTAQGLAAASYYSFVYVLMNLACFWVLCNLSQDGRNVDVSDLDGLYKRGPALAFILAVSAFALVGLPPTAGFMGKLFLLSAAWNRGYDWLVVTAAVNTAISIYYYLNLARHAYANDSDAAPVAPKGAGLLLGSALAAALLALGVAPWPVFDIAVSAGARLLP